MALPADFGASLRRPRLSPSLRLPRRQFGPSLAALAGRPEAPPARRGQAARSTAEAAVLSPMISTSTRGIQCI